jgi:hypothetical protein
MLIVSSFSFLLPHPVSSVIFFSGKRYNVEYSSIPADLNVAFSSTIEPYLQIY